MRRFIIYVGLAALSGCTALPELKKLSIIESGHVVTLNKPISLHFKAKGLGGLDQDRGLLPGEFSAVKENELGTFYLGPRCAFWEKDDTIDYVFVRQGGFWISKSSELPPKLFYIVGAQYTIVAKSLEEALLQCTRKDNSRAGSKDDVTSSISGKVIASPQSFGIRPEGAGGVIPSPAQAAGGAIGGAIIGAMIKADEGKYMFAPPLEDNNFIAALLKISRKEN